jgi:hypothetical protein
MHFHMEGSDMTPCSRRHHGPRCWPSSIQGYSVEYPNFLPKTFIYSVYVYVLKKKIKAKMNIMWWAWCGVAAMRVVAGGGRRRLRPHGRVDTPDWRAHRAWSHLARSCAICRLRLHRLISSGMSPWRLGLRSLSVCAVLISSYCMCQAKYDCWYDPYAGGSIMDNLTKTKDKEHRDLYL